MSDLISRCELFNRLASIYPTKEYIIRETTYPDATKQEVIVELVRCKDCLHNRACEIQYHAQAGDLFFCGAAERKDGDEHEVD